MPELVRTFGGHQFPLSIYMGERKVVVQVPEEGELKTIERGSGNGRKVILYPLTMVDGVNHRFVFNHENGVPISGYIEEAKGHRLKPGVKFTFSVITSGGRCPVQARVELQS